MIWMTACRTTGAAIGVAVLFAVASAPSDLAPGSKVVFLKENEVVSANADGSEQKVLTHDGVPKERPVWSPDGTKIAYVTALSTENVFHPPKALALIHVIDAAGKSIKTIPVPAEMPDGTPIEGMRFVENSGWYSDSAVFVSGSENPHYAEYRIFEVASGKLVKVYAGYGFTTCAGEGKVAYVADPEEANPEKLHVQVNGTDLIEVPADRDPRYFQWSLDCDRLAYIEEDDAAKLVVLRKNVVEARAPVGAGFDGALMVAAGQGFLLKEAGRTKYYDVTKKALATDLQDWQGMPPASIVFQGVGGKLKEIPTGGGGGGERDLQESAGKLVERLGGTSGNVWSPKQK